MTNTPTPGASLRADLHICHIIHHLAPGGAERLLLDLAAVAPAANLEISVVSIMDSEPFPYAKALTQLGVPVCDLGVETRWDPRALTRAVACVRSIGPDVVHTHLKHADIVGAFTAERLHLPMVSTLHEIEDSVTPLRRFKRRAGAAARLRRADVTVTVSDAQRRWYLRTFDPAPETVVTIHNGIRPPVPTSGARGDLRKSLGCPDDAVVGVVLAVMRPGKGHHDLIRAVAELSPGTPLQMWLAGDGELRQELEREVADLGLSSRIAFLGWRDDTADVLAAADMLVHPTHFDALPTALIEGLAAGLPAVASAVGGVAEIVTPECGALIPPGDPAALAWALTELASDPRRREELGGNARRRFDAHFSADRWALRLRDLYAGLVAGP